MAVVRCAQRASIGAARQAGRWLSGGHDHARRRADRHRVAGARDRAGVARVRDRVRAGPQGVQRADLQAAGDPVQAG
eukprot:5996454-Prymnesium_polylepis.1